MNDRAVFLFFPFVFLIDASVYIIEIDDAMGLCYSNHVFLHGDKEIAEPVYI